MIDRVSANDLVMVAMGASGRVPSQVGAVLVLAAGDGFDPAALMALIADRIRSVPRLRQRLTRVPFGCGRPIWVDDAAFDVGRHVRRVDCPAPGDEQALLDLAADAVTEPLPRSRPLWSMMIVTGLADGTVGLVVVLDHVLADGIGGVAMLAALVDEAAVEAVDAARGAAAVEAVGAAAGTPAAAFPRRRPSWTELAADAWRGRWRGLFRLLPRLRTEARAAMDAAGGFHAVPAAACSLLRPTGARRRLAVVRTDLTELRAAAHRHGGTVNDAVLTAITGALHTLLEHRGESADAFTAIVPVAVRRAATVAGLGNEVVPVMVALPGAGAPPERLKRISAVVRERKGLAAGQPAVSLVGPVLWFAARLGLYHWYLMRQRRTHTVVSNVRGPDGQLTIGGAPIRAALPLSVADGGNVTVSFTALSYAGTLAIALVFDPDHVPDVDVLTAALQAEFAALIGDDDTAANGATPDRKPA